MVELRHSCAWRRGAVLCTQFGPPIVNYTPAASWVPCSGVPRQRRLAEGLLQVCSSSRAMDENSFFLRQPVAFLNIGQPQPAAADAFADPTGTFAAAAGGGGSNPGVIGEPVQIIREPVIKNETLIPYVPLMHGHDLYMPPPDEGGASPTVQLLRRPAASGGGGASAEDVQAEFSSSALMTQPQSKGVDFIAPVADMKTIFRAITSNAEVDLAVHRIGDTIVIDEANVTEQELSPKAVRQLIQRVQSDAESTRREATEAAGIAVGDTVILLASPLHHY